MATVLAELSALGIHRDSPGFCGVVFVTKTADVDKVAKYLSDM